MDQQQYNDPGIKFASDENIVEAVQNEDAQFTSSEDKDDMDPGWSHVDAYECFVY